MLRPPSLPVVSLRRITLLCKLVLCTLPGKGSSIVARFKPSKIASSLQGFDVSEEVFRGLWLVVCGRFMGSTKLL